MVIFGKIHEISFYGLLSTLYCLLTGRIQFWDLYYCANNIYGLSDLFGAYMFWSTVLFIPIAIICALATKFLDDGEGLSFLSGNLLVIIFAHIAEEICGLVITPIWFLKDLITQNFEDWWKIVDYVTYFIEIVIIAIGLVFAI